MTRRILLDLAEDATDTRCGDWCPMMRDRDFGTCGAGFLPTLPYERPAGLCHDRDRTAWIRPAECLAAERDARELADRPAISREDAATFCGPIETPLPEWGDAQQRIFGALRAHAKGEP